MWFSARTWVTRADSPMFNESKFVTILFENDSQEWVIVKTVREKISKDWRFNYFPFNLNSMTRGCRAGEIKPLI